MYKINNIDVTTYGIVPTQFSGQSLAIAGALDFPARKGTTEHSWGTETEAFVSAADLEYEGRDISFKGIMKATTRAALITSLANFSANCKTANTTIETGLGTFPVTLTKGITIVELSSTIIILEAKFRQFVVSFPSTPGTPTGGTGYRIDGYNLKVDFGIAVLSTAGRKSIPERIEIKTTADYTNAAYGAPRDISMVCFMTAASQAILAAQMGRFQKLLSTPGMRTLTFPDETTASVYAKNGFTTSALTGEPKASGHFTLTLRQP